MKIKEWFDKLLGKDIRPLSEHPIYTQMDLWVLYKSKNLSIVSPAKKRVTEEYIKIFFCQLHLFLDDITLDPQKTATNNNLHNTLITMLERVNNKCKDDGIPVIFLDKLNSRNYKLMDMMLTTVNEIVSSKFYANDKEKIASVLDLLLFYIKVIIDNMESTVNSLNGELEKALVGTKFAE